MIFRTLTAVALALALSGGAVAADFGAALTDSGRPAGDLAKDSARKPAAILDFAHVHEGETVLELIPGAGYFTRILSKAVGPTGKVYAASPPVMAMGAKAEVIAADPRYANVKAVPLNAATLGPNGPMVDLIFTAQNYHDLHLSMAHQDVPKFDTYLFAKLKSGGILVVEDHVAADGSPATETADKLHRIDPAIVRKELESAGFVFDGQLDVLRNPADTHMLKVFDPAVQGHTDQFVFRFRKP